MKRIALFSVLLVLTVSMVFAGGGNEKVSDEGKVNLTFAAWGETQKAAMEAMVKSYQENVNPNVSVEVQITPWSEYWTKLEASAIGGNAPDIFWINGLHTEAYQEAGILYDLTETVNNSDIGLDENFPPLLTALYTLDDKLWAIPKDFDTNGLFYNKEMFDKAGVAYPTDDWTIEDLVNTAQQLVDSGLGEGKYAFTSALHGQSMYWPSIYAFGGAAFNEDKTVATYDDPAVEKGLAVWIDMIEAGLSPSLATMTETSTSAMFGAGNLAMCMGGSYQADVYMDNEEIAGKFDVVEYPMINGVEPNVINGLGYAVYANSPHKELAADMVTYFASTEAMKIHGQTSGVISARTDAHKYFVETLPEVNLESFVAHVELAKTLPISKVAAEINDVERSIMIDMYSLETPITEGIADINVKVQAVLDKMNR